MVHVLRYHQNGWAATLFTQNLRVCKAYGLVQFPMYDECGAPHFLNQLLILEPLRYHVLSDAAKEEVLDDTSDGSVRAYED